jgi:HAD superfamily hydrolase (TIGR01509 family)
MADDLRAQRCILFDWGDTLMRVFPQYGGSMHLWPYVEAMPNAADILAALHPQWTLAVATNAKDSDESDIWAALRRVELDRYLDRVFCFRTIGHKKPEPEFFAAVLNDLKVEPQQAIMVGDEYAVDVLGALRAGLRGVWFNPKDLTCQEDPGYSTIHDLKDLERILE